MDPIDDAIEAAASQPQQHTLVQVGPITIASTGRPFVLSLPEHMTEAELFEVIGWMATGLRAAIVKEQEQRRPSIILARGPLPSRN